MAQFPLSFRTLAVAFTLGVAALAAAPEASAAPVLVRDGNGGDVFSGNGLGTPPVVGIKVSGGDLSVYAGPFALQYSANNGGSWTDILTYCLEPDERLGVGASATAGDLVSSLSATVEYAAQANSIARLYSTYFADSLTTAVKAAAFQVALWELAYDSGSNLNAGSFQLTTGGTIGSQAASYLNAANWLQAGAAGVILRSGNQDLIVAVPPQTVPVPVPEPGTLALLGAGIGLLGLARRRRRD